MIYPVPKPGATRGAPPRPRLTRSRVKSRNAKRKGRAFGAARVDRGFSAWLHTLPCAICALLGVVQTTPTEEEHFVLKSHGGYDRGDCYPTCAVHREMRHGVMGPKAFTRMLLAKGLDERALCTRLAQQYEQEK
jgi:hypothetical protein